MKYLTSGLDADMFEIQRDSVTVLNLVVVDMTPEKFCADLLANKSEVVSNSTSAVHIVGKLCGVSIKASSTPIRLNPGDVLYIVRTADPSITAIISREQVQELHRKGLIRFMKILHNIQLVY